MKFVIFILLPLVISFEHLPEERVYGSTDQGYTQYAAYSLHQTSTYSLTFDDGPSIKTTPQILDALKAYDVKATFFVVTSLINDKTLPIVKRMLDEGHMVQSHDHFHDNNNTIPKKIFHSRVKQSFLELKKVYKKLDYSFDRFYFRFPYAAYGKRNDYHHINVLKEISNELFGKNCIHFAFWDIDSMDWLTGISSSEVFQNFVANHEGGTYIDYVTRRDANGNATRIDRRVREIIEPLRGGVILHHDIQERTINALKMELEYAKNNGIKYVRLDDVQEYEPAQNCTFQD
jgi:peptidoglycan/xylan/chitin deacetylase (PgdA/CDA1 family)